MVLGLGFPESIFWIRRKYFFSGTSLVLSGVLLVLTGEYTWQYSEYHMESHDLTGSYRYSSCGCMANISHHTWSLYYAQILLTLYFIPTPIIDFVTFIFKRKNIALRLKKSVIKYLLFFTALLRWTNTKELFFKAWIFYLIIHEWCWVVYWSIKVIYLFIHLWAPSSVQSILLILLLGTITWYHFSWEYIRSHGWNLG